MKAALNILLALIFIYNAVTGTVTGKTASFDRKKNPAMFWLLTPITLGASVYMIVLAWHEIFRR
jgi:hypothetical protein